MVIKGHFLIQMTPREDTRFAIANAEKSYRLTGFKLHQWK